MAHRECVCAVRCDPSTCEPACHRVADILRRSIAVSALWMCAVAPALEPTLVLRPQRRLVEQYTAALSVALDEAGAVVAIAGVDRVVGRLAVAHDPRHADVERVGHIPVPLHVARVGAVQFVLHLRQHDWAASVGEVRTRLSDHFHEPLLHRVAPHLVVRSEPHAILVRQPRRYAAVVPLCAHVRADAQVGEQAGLSDGVEEQCEVAAARPVHRVLCGLVPVPEHVDLYHVQPVRRRLLHELRPHGGSGARVVDAAGQEGDGLVVQPNGAAVIRHGVRLASVRAEQWKAGWGRIGGRQQGKQTNEDEPHCSRDAARSHGSERSGREAR